MFIRRDGVGGERRRRGKEWRCCCRSHWIWKQRETKWVFGCTACFWVCIFFSFFFFLFFFLLFETNNIIQNTVYILFKGPTTTLFIKKILKIDLMILFTCLKIILLQCFQFSVSAKISCIQTDPKRCLFNKKICLQLCSTTSIAYSPRWFFIF